MATPRLDAIPDHVAVAVPDLEAAGTRWGDHLGGALITWVHATGFFRTRQYRYPSGAVLELIQPSEAAPDPAANFVRRYLDRFGAGVHHVTLKVPDLLEAVAQVEAAGYDVIDVNTSGEDWQEAFLRPSQVGGMIVQIARSRIDVETIAEHRGYTIPDNPADAGDLAGPALRHPDLDAATRLWQVLGADVARDGDTLQVTWAGSPLEVAITRGEPAGPVGLRFRNAAPLPPDPDLGAPVLPA